SGNLNYALIRNAGAYNAALAIEGLSAGKSVQLQNSTIANSGNYGLLVRADDLHQLSMSNVTFTDNYTNRIAIRTQDDFGSPPSHYDITDTVTLTPQPGLDGYEIKGEYLTIGSPLALTMAAGSKLMFPTAGSLDVQGHLETQGTATQPVTLTSITDSGPGEWGGIYFGGSGSGSGNLNYALIRNAGAYNAALAIEGLSAGKSVQ
ncbi:MAG: hypothetical protein GY867_01850, partial [bacterium]|nr:hypothetical protein [bacterium]